MVTTAFLGRQLRAAAHVFVLAHEFVYSFDRFVSRVSTASMVTCRLKNDHSNILDAEMRHHLWSYLGGRAAGVKTRLWILLLQLSGSLKRNDFKPPRQLSRTDIIERNNDTVVFIAT